MLNRVLKKYAQRAVNTEIKKTDIENFGLFSINFLCLLSPTPWPPVVNFLNFCFLQKCVELKSLLEPSRVHKLCEYLRLIPCLNNIFLLYVIEGEGKGESSFVFLQRCFADFLRTFGLAREKGWPI